QPRLSGPAIRLTSARIYRKRPDACKTASGLLGFIRGGKSVVFVPLVQAQQSVPAAGDDHHVVGLEAVVGADIVGDFAAALHRDDVEAEPGADVQLQNGLAHELVRHDELGDVDALAQLDEVQHTGGPQTVGQAQGHVALGVNDL